MKLRVFSGACILALLTVLFGNCYVNQRPKPDIKQGEYLVTQYGDDTGQQMMFYTIQDYLGHLSIVDGGYDYGADYVRDVIEKAGGIVDNWILTHPHPDHIGAFNVIFADPGDIKIGTVYTIEMNYEAYQTNAKEWDGFYVYQNFLDVISSSDKIKYLHTGDELNILGMRMKVLNVYDDSYLDFTTDLANNGSMAFKIYGNSQSMLFCADITQKVCGKIEEQFGGELKSDFVQMGHHGNWGPDASFYQRVEPETAFFDAPSWLMRIHRLMMQERW